MSKILFSFLLFLSSSLFSEQGGVVDLIVFSYNRPMQLYALLESSERYFTGLHETHVIYRSTSTAFDAGYEVVKNAFPHLVYHKQSATPEQDFKPLVLQSLFATDASYVLFAVDDIIVTDYVNLKRCAAALDQYKAAGFYLRMGENIEECFSLSQSTPLPKVKRPEKDLLVWRFKNGIGDWNYPHTVDMTVYRKSVISPFFIDAQYTHPPSLEARWAAVKPVKKRGVSFLASKMINLPLNAVGPYQNRQLRFYSIEDLQERFMKGQKIDISRYYQMKNRAPHVDCSPTFILR